MDTSTVQQRYKDCKDYFFQSNFFNLWSECERMKSGNQWPAKTEKTKNLPRPVINIIRYIENHKVSSILNEPVKMMFSADELNDDPEDIEAKKTEVGAELFTQYSAAEWENVKQDQLNEKALDKASNIGTGIWHYYWDNNKTGGKKLKYIGSMAGEVIDAINCFVGNPQQQDTQKQPYILITGRDTVERIREEAKANGLKDSELLKISGDKDTKDEGYDTARREIKDKATVITCYWKELKPPMAYPSVQLAKVCNDVFVKPPTNTLHKLYPIVGMPWYDRDKSWYGVGDTEGLIANQKAINFMTAMQMMSVQLTGMPKLMIKGQFIDNFNNDPSSIINDINPTSWSAQYLNPPQLTAKASELTEFLMNNSKTLSGATETATGELVKSSQMNATAIMLLQKASGVPIESIKKRFRRAMEEVGNIWLEFWTINYNTARIITVEDDAGQDIPMEFRGADFKDIGVKLKIDIGASADYSESLVMTTLDKLHDKGSIDDTIYVELAPQSVMPNKQELLKYFEQKKADMLQQQMMIANQMPQPNSIPPAPQNM